jgi:CRP/FNR family transcriptional regulator, cyclic AMP receptor protein
MLDQLPEGVADRVVRSARRRRFAAGEVIFHEGDPADSLHLIVRGRVAALVTTPYGQQLTYAIQGQGEFFGELALLRDDNLRSATIRALEPTETLSVHRNDFDRLRAEHPPVEKLLVRMLAANVLRLSEQLREALYLPVEVRVRRRLLAVARVYREDGQTTVVPLTQDELAGLAGVARTTANRVLRQEEERGTIRLDRHRITIVDATELERRAMG